MVSSSKLGQNVQLLTYVSIFHLTLAFCAALWAIPNITDGGTTNAFVITAVIVGFVTYAIVFNLENIAGVFGRLYANQRDRLLQDMGDDRDKDWKELRYKFDDFPSNKKRTTPSEWGITRYPISRWLSLGRAKAAKDDEEQNDM
ncbi:uncharacterized protein N7503_005652 [Penicillium pulvis]|uniref:uncharacterized protein n=1 Tax=Penicillium pulvis TaxID=1562058 RepID=UPI00254776A3|nr:uncharacterized protein N7503_005652 [Penicillium pulvis]KAJ5803202.1 hypothetical protein N7503_005652 [Penicillium pulvis]